MRKPGMHLQRDWPLNECSAYATSSCQHHIIVKIILAILGDVLLGIPGALGGGCIGKKLTNSSGSSAASKGRIADVRLRGRHRQNSLLSQRLPSQALTLAR